MARTSELWRLDDGKYFSLPTTNGMMKVEYSACSFPLVYTRQWHYTQKTESRYICWEKLTVMVDGQIGESSDDVSGGDRWREYALQTTSYSARDILPKDRTILCRMNEMHIRWAKYGIILKFTKLIENGPRPKKKKFIRYRMRTVIEGALMSSCKASVNSIINRLLRNYAGDVKLNGVERAKKYSC